MAPVFKNQIIAVSGTFPGYKQADLKAEIEQNGGEFSAKVTETCTHLITTQKEVDNNATKNKQAAAIKGIKVVNLDWLLESVTKKRKVSEKQYLFSTSSNGQSDGVDTKKVDTNGSQSVDQDQQTQSGRKRTRKITSDSKDVKVKEEDEPPIKKQKDSKKQKDDTDIEVKSEDDPTASEAKDEQKGKSATLKVDVDEACTVPSPSVYIDDQGIIYDATLNQTNASHNNNKFYRIQVLQSGSHDTYKTWTRWGRVGEHGQTAVLGAGGLDNAIWNFEKKFKDKSGLSWSSRLDPPKKGKYTFIEKNYEPDSDDEDDVKGKPTKNGKTESEVVKRAESKLPKPVQNLMQFIFNSQNMAAAMAAMSYDAKKLPLGKLSKRTLSAGFQLLKDLSELISDPAIAQRTYSTSFQRAAEDLSNQYFTTIPHVFGRHRPPILNTPDMIKRESELLDTLTDMEIANEIMKISESTEGNEIHELDRQFNGLNMNEMTPLDVGSNEFKEVHSYLTESQGQTHHFKYQIEDIFRIERKGEDERFNSSHANIANSNRRLLWHGSRSTNFGGILSQGLRIAPPEAPVSGYMFGKGVYFADMSSKSAGYCCSSISMRTGLLLLCEVELGDPMLELTNAEYNAGQIAKEQGKLATLGQGNTAPPAWKDAECVTPELKGVQIPDQRQVAGPTGKGSSLYYNEYIVYDVAQIRQRYLLRVKM